MPLPDRNVEWPPKSVGEATKLYDEWGAWYSGDPQKLTAVYQNTAGFDLAGMGELPKGQPNGPRFLAGIRRGFQRRFWGHMGSPEQIAGHKLHIPLASDIAMTSADLLFGEPLEITVDDDKGKPDKATGDRLDEILDESNAQAVWLEAAEMASAYGGAYLRARWDPVIAECPLFDALPPDSAVPDFRGGRLVAVTLWRYLERIDGRIWRHLERHEPGRILHGVYAGNDDGKLGRPMKLQDHPETAPFAMLVDPGDGQTVTTGAKGLAVDYLPNMRPHRVLRGSPLGRSDFSGIEPLLDALDEAWSSWMRDLRLGKGRLVVPRSYVQNLGRGKGSMFDADREVYEAVDAISSPEVGLAITNEQFAIRVDEHSRTCREIIRKAIESAGYSAQTFGEVDTVAATATEVIARQERTYRTRGKKALYAKGPLARINQAALEIDIAKFGTKGIRTNRPSVKFPDGVAIDRESLARTLQLLQAAETASIETRVRLFNPDWDDPEVKSEVARIKEETAKGPVPPPGGASTPGHGPDGPITISGSPMPPGPNGNGKPVNGASAAASGNGKTPPPAAGGSPAVAQRKAPQ
jgi:hypothetical protein